MSHENRKFQIRSPFDQELRVNGILITKLEKQLIMNAEIAINKKTDLIKVKLSYVLITPAHNEEKYIEGTIQSVIKQTILPVKWVIVSDGSTDDTEKIISKYTESHPWIELVVRPKHADRQFAAKVKAFNAGFEKVQDMQYDFIGNLDADLTFDPDYMEYLIGKMENDEKLGVVGTPFVEDENQEGYDFRFANIEHVSGACQIFRKACFEEIGGYTPIKGGGIDWVAVTSARMHGWKTRTYTDRVLFHHRKMGTGRGNVLQSWYRLGREDYYLGSHPLWEVFRSFFQMRYKPYIISGLTMLTGYFFAAIRRIKRPISKELVTFYRKEQMARLTGKFLRRSS
jgi:biofilm PGA synthesis N-glycosyltransferase PgaC